MSALPPPESILPLLAPHLPTPVTDKEAQETALTEIAQLAALLCETPIALINLTVGPNSLRKICHGISLQDLHEDGVTAGLIAQGNGDELVVSDTQILTSGHPTLHNSAPGNIRFYAGTPLRAPDGKILGSLCVLDRKPRGLRPDQFFGLRSLARQVIAQLELRQALTLRRAETEQLTLMAQALNASTDGFVITDARQPDNPLIFANPAFERITGYSIAETIGRNCRFLQNEERDQPGLEMLRTAVKRKSSCRVVLRNYRKDGRAFWNELHIAPVRNTSGETTHFIGIQSDITARKEADDALRQRDLILEGVSLAAETLLHESNLDKALPRVLEQIGEATKSRHVCLWESSAQQNEPFAMAQVQLWAAPPLSSKEDIAIRAMAWDTTQGWLNLEQLRQGRVLQLGVASNSPNEELLLQNLGLKTFLFLPVFTEQASLWGALTLGLADHPTQWGFAEIEALRSATRILGSVIHDRETGKALRASEERFRSVVTNLKEVVFQTDAAGLWTFLNPAWTEITGFSVEQSLGTLFLDYVHPDDRERNNRLFGPLIERKKDYCRHEVRYLTKDGGYRWVEVFARLVLDAKDQIIGTAGTLNDITARKNSEETLQKQRAAIEAAIDGVAILDEEGRSTYINATLAGMFGHPRIDALIDKPWQEIFKTAASSRLAEEGFKQLHSTGKWRGAVSATRPDGSSFTAEFSLTRIEGGGVVCVCRDITERIEAEQFILSSLKEKEVLLKEIHHRVKNNMQIVSSLLNLQLDHLQDEKSRMLFMESQARIASMALVHEKLYQSADLARIDFNEYLRDLTDNIVSVTGAKARNIFFELKTGDAQLGIDTAIPCGLIINELISNAYKHGFPNGGPGRVSLSLEKMPDGRFRIEVADSGRGIPTDFDVKKSRSLGMQLVYTLVQQLRGTLEIVRGKAELGQTGTRFIILIQESARKESHR
ncbi:MAG: PAS domain S-box protein [Nibricoccus sp.]